MGRDNNRMNQFMNQPQPVEVRCDIITPTIIEVLSFLVQKSLTEEERRELPEKIFDVLWGKMHEAIEKIKHDPNMSSFVISGEYDKFVQNTQNGIHSLLTLIAGVGESKPPELRISEDE